jgi:hypothetical protein
VSKVGYLRIDKLDGWIFAIPVVLETRGEELNPAVNPTKDQIKCNKEEHDKVLLSYQGEVGKYDVKRLYVVINC